MTSCEKVMEVLWEYLDREIDEKEVIVIQKHIDLCRSCFTRAEFERQLRDHCKKKTEHLCPDKVKLRIQQIIELY